MRIFHNFNRVFNRWMQKKISIQYIFTNRIKQIMYIFVRYSPVNRMDTRLQAFFDV